MTVVIIVGMTTMVLLLAITIIATMTLMELVFILIIVKILWQLAINTWQDAIFIKLLLTIKAIV
jgi:Tfp pilus assembly protein PilE